MNIIFEDQYLLAVNKPSGILVVPTPKGEKYTLTNLVNKILSERGSSIFAYPCHRLDRDTSGIVLFAKDKETEKEMFSQFKKRSIKKRYVAIVSGCPAKNHGIINKKVEGLEALTRYHVIKRKKGYSILDVEPVTGRTNQIRIHLKFIGHPVLGERKYAFGKDFKIKFRRTALHAVEMSFRHPVTGGLINLKAAIPDDMKRLM